MGYVGQQVLFNRPDTKHSIWSALVSSDHTDCLILGKYFGNLACSLANAKFSITLSIINIVSCNIEHTHVSEARNELIKEPIHPSRNL